MDLKGMKAKASRKNMILNRQHYQARKLVRHYASKGVSTSVKPKAKYVGLGSTGGVPRTMVFIKERIKGLRERSPGIKKSLG